MVDAIIDEVIKAMGVGLTALIMWLVGLVIQKFRLSISADQQAKLEYVAKQAVLRVEEYAATEAKKRLGGMSQSQKLNMAVTDVVEKIPRVDRAEAERIVTAVLPQLGIGAAAGVTHLGEALRTAEARP